VGKVAKTANTSVLIVSVLIILLVVNFLAARHFMWRVDLTENKIYTLSESSKKIAGELNDLVTIKAYFSEKMPPYLSNIRQQVEDLLEEFQAYSKGNLRVEFIDPGEDDELKRKLMYDGIMPLNLQTIDRHKFEVMEAYFGMVVNYEDRKETIPVAEPNSLEYDLSAAIKKVSLPKPPVVGFLTNDEELEINRDYREMSMRIQKLYDVRPVNLQPGQKIPADIDVLFLIAPKDFSDSELFEIDQFVMRGGQLICLADVIDLDERTLRATADKPNISRLLEKYGIQMNEDLIEDHKSNAVASFSTGFMRTMINYPFWVSVEKGLNQESPITKRLGALVLPWISSVEPAEEVPEGVEIKTLASTTEYAYRNEAPFDLNPFKRDRPRLKKEDLEKYSLVLLAEGEFPSAFEGEEIPEAKKLENEDQAGYRPPNAPTTEKDRKNRSPETSVLVAANSLFARDQYIASTRSEGNLIFLENLVDSMALGQELMGIRTRASAQRPIKKELTDAQKTAYKWFAILGVPVLVIIFGLLHVPWVRARRRYYETILTKE